MFFFQAEDGIRDLTVTGVQTCALPISRIDGNTNKLKDVTLYDLSDAERRRIIRADSGRMAYSAGGRDLFLTLMDGDIEEVNRTDPTQFNRTFYSTNRMRVRSEEHTSELQSQSNF